MHGINLWLSGWLLEIPIPKQVSETLERLLDIPLIFRLVRCQHSICGLQAPYSLREGDANDCSTSSQLRVTVL